MICFRPKHWVNHGNSIEFPSFFGFAEKWRKICVRALGFFNRRLKSFSTAVEMISVQSEGQMVTGEAD